jgi:poly-beta-1,6-N-acetyl-D-glucosamine biosynthesis protein PgaD
MPEIKIRDNPGLRSFLRNISETTFTGFIWAVWIYFLLPVINVVFWIFGFQLINIAVIEQVGYEELLQLLMKMGWAVVIVFVIFHAWGYYNYMRFGKRSRRKASAPVTIEALAEHYGIPADEIRGMQKQKEIVWPNIQE